MKCPSCNDVDLLMSERQGIEIDYCPKCRGVWLDRGELDKFIQQSEGRMQSEDQIGRRTDTLSDRSSKEFANNHESPSFNHNFRRERNDDDEDRGYSQRGKKKESFWGDLFDFG
jgi:uncharacterized protein